MVGGEVTQAGAGAGAATLESEVREAGVEGLIDMVLFGVAMVRLRAVCFSAVRDGDNYNACGIEFNLVF